MNTEKNTEKLNDLLEYLHDSHDGYIECSGETQRPALKTLFTRLAAKREQMMQALEQEILRLWGEPVKKGSMLAAAHRLFVDLKSLLTGHDDEAILNEIRRGESHLVARYREVINSDLYADLKPFLSEQLRTLEADLQQIKLEANAVA